MVAVAVAVFITEKYVLGFDISMDPSTVVHGVETLADTLEHLHWEEWEDIGRHGKTWEDMEKKGEGAQCEWLQVPSHTAVVGSGRSHASV